MTVAILVPVLGRPHSVVPLIESIEAATTVAHRIIFIADAYDTAQKRAVRESAADLLIVDGGYGVKINAGIRATAEPFVFMAADDLRFHSGWFEAAHKLMDDRTGVVGTNDLCNRRVTSGVHATHSLVARSYCSRGAIDNPDAVLHEGYDHSFVDDEFVSTAKHRKAFAMALDSIVEHRHPMNDTAADDDTYRKGRAQFRQDKRLFQHRRALWT